MTSASIAANAKATQMGPLAAAGPPTIDRAASARMSAAPPADVSDLVLPFLANAYAPPAVLYEGVFGGEKRVWGVFLQGTKRQGIKGGG
jgi:hypothetical protein